MPICLAGLKGTIAHAPHELEHVGEARADVGLGAVQILLFEAVAGQREHVGGHAQPPPALRRLDKADPAANAGSLKTDPWTLKISGEVAKPLTLDHDDLTRRFPLEERIYRMRCVEAWSMVVPWIGFPLHKLLALAEPTSNAKYVAFETIYAPEQMPGQQDRFIGGGLKYPYVEGLRLDEAMHPLTLMTVGVYGKALPPQNGAPVRLIVPWKYGFKGIKSIVSIKLTRERPPTTWNLAAPDEYGFYANVNPHVDHPRWSQATERFIGSGGILDVQRQPTLLFNGYADQVASLYRGLDLRENF